MRIYCKASPMFKNPDPLIPEQDKGKFVRCSPGFHDVPEWVRKDATFISSVKAGVVEVVESKATASVPGLTKAQQKALAKEIGQEIELIDECKNQEDLDSIKGGLKHLDNQDVIEAMNEKAESFKAGA